MKKLILLLLCAVLVAQCETCFAYYGNNECEPCSGVYLKGFGGLNMAQESRWSHVKYRTNTGFVLGGALGYKFDIFCLEGEFAYRHNTVDRLRIEDLNIHVTGDIEQWCGFGNALVNIPLHCALAPYVGVGFGYRHAKPGVNFDDSDDTSFRSFIDSVNEWGVYQAIAGLKLAVSRTANLRLEYRYVDGWSNINCSNHSADLCVGVLF